jgi:NADP-dependent 3-hydroxy acid dehydrogenase YdfG
MTRRLAGTAAIITGASSGIGEATATALAAEGAAVALLARRADRLEALAARIDEQGGRALAVEVDVTDEDRARAAIGRVAEELGRVDILVNNAGVMLLGRAERIDTANWRRMIDLNVTALMMLSHAAMPHLLQAAEGEPRRVADIVNISSVAGRVARAGSGGYNASKWAVNAFSEALRQEVARRHLRVGLVEPGAVSTELASHNADPEVLEGMQKRFGEIELLEAEDIAAAIVFMVTRPRHVAVNELLVRPTEQAD